MYNTLFLAFEAIDILFSGYFMVNANLIFTLNCARNGPAEIYKLNLRIKRGPNLDQNILI